PVAPAVIGRVIHRSQLVESSVIFAPDRTLYGVNATYRGRKPIQQTITAPGGGLENIAKSKTALVLVLKSYGSIHLRAPGISIQPSRIREAGLEIPGAAP